MNRDDLNNVRRETGELSRANKENV